VALLLVIFVESVVEKRRKIMAINKPEDAHRLFANAFNSGNLESIIALYESEWRLVGTGRL
jgi:hypothetical protein